MRRNENNPFIEVLGMMDAERARPILEKLARRKKAARVVAPDGSVEYSYRLKVAKTPAVKPRKRRRTKPFVRPPHFVPSILEWLGCDVADLRIKSDPDARPE